VTNPAAIASVDVAPPAPAPAPGVTDQRPSVLRNMAHMLSSQAATWALATVAHVLSARFLGPEAVGQLRFAFSLWLIAQVFITLGTSTYLTLEMARDVDRGASLVGPILLLRIAAFGVATAAIGVYALAVGADSETVLLLAVVGSTILLMTLADTYGAALIGLEQMAYPALAGVLSKAAYTVALVALLLAGGGVVGVAAMTTFNAALGLLLLRHFYRRFGRASFAFPVSALPSIVRGSSGFLAAGAIVVVYLQIDTIVIATLVDEQTLGWYTTADLVAGSMLFVPTIMMATLFPVIGRLHSADEAAGADVVRRAFSALFPTGVAIGFGTIVVAEPICLLLFGEAYRESGAVLAVLGLMMPLIFATMMMATVAMATGRQRFWNTLMASAVVLTVVLDIILVPLMDRIAGNGAIGGAISYVITEALMLGFGMWKIVPITHSAASLARIGKSLLAGVAMVAAAWPLRDEILIVPALVGATVFAGAIVALGVLTDDERAMIRQLAGRMGIGRTQLAGAGVVVAPDEDEHMPVVENPGG
jgi:O-antigen/teichoic acid export membrane protein